MTRAQEILYLLEAIGDPKPFKKPVSPFKHQWAYQPGQKIPQHLKRRQTQKKLITTRSKDAYDRPWKGQHDDPKDKSSSPLDAKYKPISVKRTG